MGRGGAKLERSPPPRPDGDDEKEGDDAVTSPEPRPRPTLADVPQSNFLSMREGGVEDIRQMRYASLVVAWCVLVGVLGGTIVWLVERGGRAGARWPDCVFLALNCVTATGLSTLDVAALRWPSLVLLALFMQLGAATLLSLVPILVRINALRRALPRVDRHVAFDLRKYKRVPQWLVEYADAERTSYLIRVAAAPRPATWMFRRDESRRRRGLRRE